MMFDESSYYPPFFGFLLSVLIFIIIEIHISKRYYQQVSNQRQSTSVHERTAIFLTFAICTGICLFGIRGRMGYNPIKVSAAYHCTDPFLNQIGISPTFNLLNSTLESSRKVNQYLHLMPEEEAIANTQRFFRTTRTGRHITTVHTDSIRRPNIVFVFMEEISNKRINRQYIYTPFASRNTIKKEQ